MIRPLLRSIANRRYRIHSIVPRCGGGVGEVKPAGDVKDDVSKSDAGRSDTTIPLSPLSRYLTVGILFDRTGLLVDEADKENEKQHVGDGDHAPGKAMSGDKEEREGDLAHFVQDEVKEVKEEVLEVESLKVVGQLNITLLLLIVADVIVSGYMKKKILKLLCHRVEQSRARGHTLLNPATSEYSHWCYGDIASDLVLAMIVLTGWKLTPKARTSRGDPFEKSGGLSGFFDNAPTYALFFGEAGSDPVYLMNEGEEGNTIDGHHVILPGTTVFMGANMYIGNAPNFLVRGIAQENGLQMPSFFAYMLCAICILGPVFVVDTFIFFWS
ncbi:hypothetical protein M427DRAFT_499497 [Gonapodya prolifera JEL478]|uniref:Uncharacterized protein n=1 Tax=Gonapodya prolifera (strain JEL478) TaxID=1344416 RepID=A0A139AB97_GONPJ|nr:hypothetical protein M427DRAFT_499497 [Gonapodya prolifera JEL478]|eukprot:KXS14076.1 hypothetical protein M427DRAFT_499497 [Gonapodya prolifera JEL478]